MPVRRRHARNRGPTALSVGLGVVPENRRPQRPTGKKTTAGRSVRDKREAEWLAATIKKALGI